MKRALKIISLCLGAIVIALFLSIFVFVYSHEYYPVVGQSMSPTINKEENSENGVYVNPNDKGTFQQVVVAKSVTDPDKTVVKRILGLAGDKLAFVETEGVVELYRIPNGENTPVKVDEPYLKNFDGNKLHKQTLESSKLDKKNFEYISVNNVAQKFIIVGENEVFYQECGKHQG